jgi:threonine/homoserine/homoserine lactone efflux protein
MTAHEVFTALFWIVAGSYLAYLGWFVARTVRNRLQRTGSGRHTSRVGE